MGTGLRRVGYPSTHAEDVTEAIHFYKTEGIMSKIGTKTGRLQTCFTGFSQCFRYLLECYDRHIHDS